MKPTRVATKSILAPTQVIRDAASRKSANLLCVCALAMFCSFFLVRMVRLCMYVYGEIEYLNVTNV